MTPGRRTTVLTTVLWWMTLPSATALVPHSFWNGRRSAHNHDHDPVKQSRKRTSTRQSLQLYMYFDDCERRSDEERGTWWSAVPSHSSRGTGSSSVPWIMSRSEEKQRAIEQLLGYNPAKASQLTAEQIEEETLQWAVDCKIVWTGDSSDDDADGDVEIEAMPSWGDANVIGSKYTTISDLLVDGESTDAVGSLAFLWRMIARLLEKRDSNAVHLVVFPNATSLWDYDVMVTMLQALAMSKPLLPADQQHLQLDLFHPNYKNSPRMWSPETHSPFPTVALSFGNEPSSSYPTTKQSFTEDLDEARSRFEALFHHIDADDVVNTVYSGSIDIQGVMASCQTWAEESFLYEKLCASTVNWVFEPHKEPFQIYSQLWSAVSNMQQQNNSLSQQTTMFVAPYLDAHTTQRIAITVNAALQRLKSPVRVANVFHPNAPSSRNAPYAMIQLKQTKSEVLFTVRAFEVGTN